MGIGTDAALALLATTTDRAEIAAAHAVLHEALVAIDHSQLAAERSFMEARKADFDASQSAAREAAVAEVTQRHAEKSEKPKGKK